MLGPEMNAGLDDGPYKRCAVPVPCRTCILGKFGILIPSVLFSTKGQFSCYKISAGNGLIVTRDVKFEPTVTTPGWALSPRWAFAGPNRRLPGSCRAHHERLSLMIKGCSADLDAVPRD